MMSNESQLEVFLTEFTVAVTNDRELDFSVPEQQSLYVQGLHGGTDVVARLRRDIMRTSGGGVFLFTGQSGSGKSTELLKLRYQLIQQGAKAYYCDLKQWLNINEPITLSSFLLALLASWVDQLGTVHGQRSPAERLVAFLTSTSLVPEGIKLKAGEKLQAQLEIALKTDENFRRDLEKALRRQLTGFLQQAQSFVADVIADICRNGERCVILADSLEKVQGFGEKANDVYTSIQQLFVSDGAALRLPGAYVVYSVSSYLLEQNNQLSTALGTGDIVNMPSVHVLKARSFEDDDAGLNAVCDVVRQRFPRWGEAFSSEQLMRMARGSGGDLRDFLRAVRIALSGDIERLPVADAEIDYALQKIRPSDNIPAEHIEWLARVHRSFSAALGGDITGLTLQRYLASKHVLAYQNSSNWYAVHPLLREWVVKRASELAAEHAPAQPTQT